MPTLPEPFRAFSMSPVPLLTAAIEMVEHDNPDRVPVLLVGGEEYGGRLVVMREADCLFLFPPA